MTTLTMRLGLVAAGLSLAAGVVTAGMATSATASTRHHQISVVRAATKAYHSRPVATKAGYGLFKDANGVACISMPGMGGMGVHLVNGALVDGTIQLRHPEGLVYRFGRNGYLKLAAVEYVTTVSAWREAHGQDAARPRLFGHRFNFTPAGNRYGLPAFYSLHAWVWYSNPAGTLQMWNPRVHCPTGV